MVHAHFRRRRVTILACLALGACASRPPQVGSESRADSTSVSTEPARPLAPADTTSAVLVGAGDIAACQLTGAAKTARLLDAIPGTVFVAGDAAYGSATVPNPFITCYDATWGRHKARTRAVPGNHDYEVTGLPMYFDYFGAAAGPRPDGYYSFELGQWHILALNSNIEVGVESAEYAWIRADLARFRNTERGYV